MYKGVQRPKTHRLLTPDCQKLGGVLEHLLQPILIIQAAHGFRLAHWKMSISENVGRSRLAFGFAKALRISSEVLNFEHVSGLHIHIHNIYIYIYTYIYTYIHTCMHTYIHTYIRIYRYILSNLARTSQQDGLLPATLVRVNRFGAPARSLLVPWWPGNDRFAVQRRLA